MKMKDLSKTDLPREKLAKYGPTKLADHELLAIIIGSGTRGANVLQLSKKVLKQIRSGNVSFNSIKGFGPARSLQMAAVLELGKRLFGSAPQRVVSPEKVFELCVDIRDSRKEHLVAFYLNSNSALIAKEVISVGILNESLVHPREVFEPGIKHAAAYLILAHNHPSGNVEPSEADVEVTDRIARAGELVGIHLSDHVIVTKSQFLSFRRQGLLST